MNLGAENLMLKWWKLKTRKYFSEKLKLKKSRNSIKTLKMTKIFFFICLTGFQLFIDWFLLLFLIVLLFYWLLGWQFFVLIDDDIYYFLLIAPLVLMFGWSIESKTFYIWIDLLIEWLIDEGGRSVCRKYCNSSLQVCFVFFILTPCTSP